MSCIDPSIYAGCTLSTLDPPSKDLARDLVVAYNYLKARIGHSTMKNIVNDRNDNYMFCEAIVQHF